MSMDVFSAAPCCFKFSCHNECQYFQLFDNEERQWDCVLVYFNFRELFAMKWKLEESACVMEIC